MANTASLDASKPRTNWAGNLVYGAERVVAPRTIAEAQEVVRAARTLRTLGSRHCFNDIADTPGTQLSLEHLNGVIALDTARNQVTVEGGIRYGELGPYLHERGYALINMASLPHISVAGACATATHGSGSLGNLATAVAAIDLIDGKGDLVTLSRMANADTFPGAVVNLGALGVVTRLTLDIRPAFHIRQDIFIDLPFAALENNFAAIMAGGYSVSLFTAWQTDTVEQVWVKSAAEPGVPFTVRDSLFGARPAAVKMHPIAGVDPVNCTEQIGVPGPAHDRLPHFRMGFTPASGDELQVEYFVPIPYVADAIRALRRFGPAMAGLLLVGEVRTIAADDLWLSPCYRTACVAFHFSFKSDWPAVRALLPGLEEVLAPFQPRPHWGKMFTLAPAKIRALYPKLADFHALMKRHDPTGKFRNAYLERTIL